MKIEFIVKLFPLKYRKFIANIYMVGKLYCVHIVYQLYELSIHIY